MVAARNGHAEAAPERTVTVSDLDALYDNWAHGTPLPPGTRSAEDDAFLNALYDEILASEEQDSRNRKHENPEPGNGVG
jgi:hypothetical protein